MDPTDNSAIILELAALRDEFTTKVNVVIGKYTKPNRPVSTPPAPVTTEEANEEPAPVTTEEADEEPAPVTAEEADAPTSYHSAGLAAIQAAEEADLGAYAKTLYTTVWNLALSSQTILPGDEPALWSCMLQFSQEHPGLSKSTRSKYMSALYSVASKYMGLTEPREYKELRVKLEEKVNSDNRFKAHDDATLEKMLLIPNSGGQLLTTAHLRSIVAREVAEMTKDPVAYELNTLRKRHPKKSNKALQKAAVEKGCIMDVCILGCSAFHGHREQDALIPYGESNKDTTTTPGCCAYYDPGTSTLHLKAYGKERLFYPDRTLVLHPDVATAFRLYHEGATHKHLIPPCFLKAPLDPYSDPILEPAQSLQDRLKKILPSFALPKVTFTNLRALWELHTLFIENMPEEELSALWRTIGHSPDTALAWYNQKFSGLLKHKSGYALSQSELPLVLV
jgi:hypothetical protein